MRFSVFDFLFALVLVLAAVAAAAAFVLVEPYPAVIVAAFAAGAATFLYLTIRVKMGGIVATVERRLEEQEAAAAEHRQAIDKSFAELEKLSRETHEQITAANDKSHREVEALRANVNGVIKEFNGQVSKIAASLREIQTKYDTSVTGLEKNLAATARDHKKTAASLEKLTADFNDFVAEEQGFRKTMGAELAQRVSELRDFIREKRKSLQI